MNKNQVKTKFKKPLYITVCIYVVENVLLHLNKCQYCVQLNLVK